MDLLTIKGLAVSTHIGVHAWEQQIKQRLLIDLVMHADFEHCNEDISLTIDYDALCKGVREFVESKKFNLIETVANEIAFIVKKTFDVKQVTVSVSKPHAIAQIQNIMVTVNR